MIGVPLAWAVVLLFHPTGDGDDFYPVVGDQVTEWIAVHVATLLFVPLIGAVVYLLLRGIDGAEARVARIALVPFAVFYTAWEVLIGIGTGVLADRVNGLPAAEQATGAKVLENFTDSGLLSAIEMIGTGSWLVALTATGIALRRRAGAPIAVPILLVLAAIPIAWHVTPFGQVGLAIFVVAVLLAVRARRHHGVTAAPAVRPAAA